MAQAIVDGQEQVVEVIASEDTVVITENITSVTANVTQSCNWGGVQYDLVEGQSINIPTELVDEWTQLGLCK